MTKKKKASEVAAKMRGMSVAEADEGLDSLEDIPMDKRMDPEDEELMLSDPYLSDGDDWTKTATPEMRKAAAARAKKKKFAPFK